MNKLLVATFTLFCFSSLIFAQEKLQFGLSTEGSWFMPAEISKYSFPNKNGFGFGIGGFFSRNVFWRFSTDLGLNYRYTVMQQYLPGEYTADNLYINPIEKLPMHFIIVPIHLRLHITKSLFLNGGIEAAWLLNYDEVNEKPEFNWSVGFGSDRHKLRWSLNYIKGFKDQGFMNSEPEADGHYKGSIYRNNMLQLSLSYPIWQKK